jgi:hypothetical protein
VVHACNPSYSGGRDQENLKKIQHKKGLVEWFKVQALNSNPSTEKKEKKRERERKRRKEGGRATGPQASTDPLMGGSPRTTVMWQKSHMPK